MIAPHKPPFGIGTIIASAIRFRRDGGIKQLEDAYGQVAGMEAIWLPSARAGICWGLRASINAFTTVLGPAFTCRAVHEAMTRAGGQVKFIDAGDNFLMQAEALSVASQMSNSALVLCEVYGHTYDLKSLTPPSAPAARIRIVDMAMAVPHPALFQRLQTNDFALISFGAGKSMYAGWGAMSFSRDTALAREVRNIRDSLLTKSDFKLFLKRAMDITSRVVAHWPVFYSSAQKFKRSRRNWSAPELHPPGAIPAEWSNERTLSPEWHVPSTHLDRNLTAWNLEKGEVFHGVRLDLARRYHFNLEAAKELVRPTDYNSALSHYTIRVSSGVRTRLAKRLWKNGIPVIALWAFAPYLDHQHFPSAFRLASEVLNLPLSTSMRRSDVDCVCEILIRSLKECRINE